MFNNTYLKFLNIKKRCLLWHLFLYLYKNQSDMKLLTFLFSVLILNGCYAQKNIDDMTITYEAATRGSSINLVATSTKINYEDFESKKEIVVTSEFWNEITEITNKITLSNMSYFTPPSDSRATDSALHATLSITIDNKTYKSQTFDHGNPPKEIKPLIDKLFSIINKR